MGFLKRVSDSFWSLLSPKKPDADAPKQTPQTVPKTKKPAIPVRRGSCRDIVNRSRSMSPVARVDSWRVGSSSRATSSVTGKRKQSHSPSSGAGRRRKNRKLAVENMEYTPELDYDGDTHMDEDDAPVYEEDDGAAQEDENVEQEDEDVEYEDDEEELEDEDDEDIKQEDEDGVEYDEDEDAEQEEYGDVELYEDDEDEELASSISNIRVQSKSPSKSPSSKGYVYEDEDDDMGQDTTVLVSEEEYNRSSPNRRKVIRIPEEHSSRHVSTEELRAAGWDDDHITLVQRIAMRGFEPLLPRFYQWDYRYLPDLLFSKNEEAFINSVKPIEECPSGKRFRAIKALTKLIEMGGWVRQWVNPNNRISNLHLTPEVQIKRSLTAYMKWANQDADFDMKTAIPLLAITLGPADMSAHELQERARKRLAKLYARYETAFAVQRSIEITPSSSSTAKLAYPIPQLYCIIGSATIAALVAYRPDYDDEQDQVKPVAAFDFSDKDYDVWNALALAILVCHVRNVQVRVAEETGLGVKVPGQEEPESDPDL